MRDQVIELLQKVLREMDITDISPLVTRPEDASHGDYATSVALVLAKKIGKKPIEIAKEIQERIIKHQKASKLPWLDRIEIASPGFINVFVSEANIINQLGRVLVERDRFGMTPIESTSFEKMSPKPSFMDIKKAGEVLASKSVGKIGRKTRENLRSNTAFDEIVEKKIGRQDKVKHVMIEFADPNPFKEFHIGHLRNIVLGESFSRLLEATGDEVRRVNYQGDVGMHVAKALYGLKSVEKMKTGVSTKEKAEFLGKAYAVGAKVFEDPSADGKEAKKQIIELNKKVYAQDSGIIDFWKQGRQWSLDYFDRLYERVGTKFTRFYFESEVAPLGVKIVKEHIKDGVFEESEGAVVFRGEKLGLHTRVFITKENYATYEAKDLALAPLKYSEYPYDLSIIMTGNEQSPYFSVMLAALRQINPELASKTKHIPFGMVRLTEGKMSSRTGNVITADWLIDQVKQRIYDILQKNDTQYSKEIQNEIAEKAAVAAVKYSMLKVTAQSDIAFDIEKSVSFDGDSGPYLQYAYARCKSVLRKSKLRRFNDRGHLGEKEERELARFIGFFPEIVADAAKNFAPNTLCTYLFQLAQAFNLLYAKHEILKNDLRLTLTAATAQILKNGLYLLGIDVLEQM